MNIPQNSICLLQQLLMHIPLVRKMLKPAKLNGILFSPDLVKQVKGQHLFEKYLKSIAYEVKDSS